MPLTTRLRPEHRKGTPARQTIHAASAARADVQTAIDAAAAGDIVSVPAGSATWSTQLAFTKGVWLVGAGVGLTNITASYTGSWLISYTPSDYSLNMPLRISGFTFDFDFQCGGIILNYGASLTIQNRVRIDHNEFKDALTQALMINGYRGVADNNTFTGTAYPVRFASGYDYGGPWWNNWEGLVFGQTNGNFYFEDNAFTIDEILVDCQEGNRYAFRYNTIVATDAGGSYPLMDLHGNQGDGFMFASFGAEIYGNDITLPNSGQVLDQRAGRTVVFYNLVRGTVAGGMIKMREEYCDGLNPSTNAQPQHVSDSYNWCNFKTSPSSTPIVAYLSQNDCGSYSIAENTDYWNFSATYNGSTPGVGAGSSLPGSCTTGDAYWLTTQSVSDLTDHIGPDPTTPISGTLYRATATNTWTAYFTPLAYPHPLRSEMA